MEDTRAIMNQQKPSSLVEDTPAIMKKLQLKSSLFRRSQRTKDWIRERPTDRIVEGTKHSTNSNKRPDMMLSFSLFAKYHPEVKHLNYNRGRISATIEGSSSRPETYVSLIETNSC